MRCKRIARDSAGYLSFERCSSSIVVKRDYLSGGSAVYCDLQQLDGRNLRMRRDFIATAVVPQIVPWSG